MNADLKVIVGLAAMIVATVTAFWCYVPLASGWDFHHAARATLAETVGAAREAGHVLTVLER